MQDTDGFRIISNYWKLQGFHWNQNNQPRRDKWSEDQLFLQCWVQSLPEQQETGTAVPGIQFHHHIICHSNKVSMT